MTTNNLLRLLNKAGIKATPPNVFSIRCKISDAVNKAFWNKQDGIEDANPEATQFLYELAKTFDALYWEITEINAEPAFEKVRPASTAFKQGKVKPVSTAADLALHDRIQAPHRPGGKLMPRPRFSEDEPIMEAAPSWIRHEQDEARHQRRQEMDRSIAQLLSSMKI